MQEDRNPNRRRVLKGAAVAGAAALTIVLPSKWTRPIVESIIVPAHAAASLSVTTTPVASTTTGTTTPTTTIGTTPAT